MTLTAEEIAEPRKKGAAYESIEKWFGISRQAVWAKLKRRSLLTYVRYPRVTRPRGRNYSIWLRSRARVGSNIGNLSRLRYRGEVLSVAGVLS